MASTTSLSMNTDQTFTLDTIPEVDIVFPHHERQESLATLPAALPLPPRKRSRGHRVCEMPGCSRLSRKGASSEKARFCTRHGGGRPCRYHGCRVASRGLLGFCYKHRHHSGHCFDSKSSCDGLNSQSRYRPPATNNQMSRQSNGWRCDQPGESGLTLPFTESSLMDDLGRCTSISLGTSEVDKTPEKTSAEYMAFTFDSSYDHASFLNLDELFCVPSALLSLEESLWLTATTPLKY